MNDSKNITEKINKNYFNENGYIELNNLFSKNKLRKIRSTLIEILNKSIKDNLLINQTESDSVLVNQIEIRENEMEILEKFILGVFQRTPEIYQLAVDKKIIQICKLLNIEDPYMISDPLIMLHSNSKNISNLFSQSAPWHQDWQSMQGSKNSIVIWVPLVDIIPKVTGGLHILKKSHLHGLLECKTDNWFANINESKNNLPKLEEAIPNIKLGSGIVFSSLCVHKSFKAINSNNLLRIVMQFRYSDRGCNLLRSNKFYYNYGHCLPLTKENPKNIPEK